jgi:hypothetical protein
MREKDYHKFVKAMIKVVDAHKNRNNWTIMRCSDMPMDAKAIMSIWSFKCKHYPDGSLNKHKACLCAHGGMQTWSQNYWETYAPLVNWASVCLILAIAKIHGLSSKSINFVLAFPQADLENPLYMELPIGFDAPINEDQKFYVLKLDKSLCGLKQAGYNWFAKLSNGLQDLGFVQSSVDPCIFFGHKCIVLTCVDDCILVRDLQDWLNALVTSLHNGNKYFALQNNGSIGKYLGVYIAQVDGTSFQLTQPFLIERITQLLGIDKVKSTRNLLQWVNLC